MNEGDQRSVGTRARTLIDQPDAPLFQACERRREVVDAQRDVVQTRSTFCRVLGNRRAVIGCLEQFERSIADSNEVGAHALRRNLFNRSLVVRVVPWLDVQAERIMIEAECLSEIRPRNADVIQSRLHNALFMMSSTAE